MSFEGCNQIEIDYPSTREDEHFLEGLSFSSSDIFSKNIDSEFAKKA